MGLFSRHGTDGHRRVLEALERFPRFLACRCCHWRTQDEAVSASCEVVSWDSLKPDLLICRSVVQLTKHSLFCQVPPVRVFSMHVVSNPYRVPMLDAEQDVNCSMCDYLDLPASVPRHLGAEFKVVGSMQHFYSGDGRTRVSVKPSDKPYRSEDFSHRSQEFSQLAFKLLLMERETCCRESSFDEKSGAGMIRPSQAMAQGCPWPQRRDAEKEGETCV